MSSLHQTRSTSRFTFPPSPREFRTVYSYLLCTNVLSTIPSATSSREARKARNPVLPHDKEVHSEGNQRCIPQSQGNSDVEVLLLRDRPSKPLDLVEPRNTRCGRTQQADPGIEATSTGRARLIRLYKRIERPSLDLQRYIAFITLTYCHYSHLLL